MHKLANLIHGLGALCISAQRGHVVGHALTHRHPRDHTVRPLSIDGAELRPMDIPRTRIPMTGPSAPSALANEAVLRDLLALCWCRQQIRRLPRCFGVISRSFADIYAGQTVFLQVNSRVRFPAAPPKPQVRGPEIGEITNQRWNNTVDITDAVLTKLDGTAKGGIVFRVQQELGVPVKLVGLGEGPDDLAPFEPGAFVDALLG